MKRISLLLVTVLVCMISSAQVTWNVKAGAGLATLRGDVEDVQGKLGWKIGVGIEKPLSVNWLIMPSLEYKQKGTSFSNNYYEETISMSYLQLPILGAYRIRLSDDVNMALKVGPYLAYMLSGKDKYTENGVKNEVDLFDLEDVENKSLREPMAILNYIYQRTFDVPTAWKGK